MAIRKGDKVVLLCVKNVYGVEFHAIFGTFKGVRDGYGFRVYKVKAKKSLFIQGSTDMQGKVMEVSSSVFTVHKLTPEVLKDLKETREATQALQAQLTKFKKGTSHAGNGPRRHTL